MRDARRGYDEQCADAGTRAAEAIRHESAAALVRDEHRRDRVRCAYLVVEFGVVHARNAGARVLEGEGVGVAVVQTG